MSKLTLVLALTLSLGAGQFALASGQGNETNERQEPAEQHEVRTTGNAILMEAPARQMEGDDVLVQKPAPEAAKAFHAGTTLENLQAAFDGESNAAAKYTAFSKKADEEGFGAVASLFRAAAHAEKIHAENHADVIRAMGAEPKAVLKPVEVKSTADNLRAAVEGESFERDVMYPAYMQVARRDRDRNALRTFNYAQVAETHHAAYYTEAGEKLLEYKDSKGETWYVCPTCGETLRAADLANMTKCPVCFTRTRTFEPVS